MDFTEAGSGVEAGVEGREGLMSTLDSAGEGGAVGMGVGAGEMCMCETGEDASEWLGGRSWNFLVGGKMESRSRPKKSS